MNQFDKMNVKSCITISLLLLHAFVFSQVERVEPPNWWTGMKNENLQLMLYGKQLSGSGVLINYPGINIRSVSSVQNENYLFVDLLIERDTRPGTFEIKLQKQGKTYASVNYELHRRDEGAARTEGFNSSDVIYLLMPDRFANGDPGNDVIKSMRETTVDRNEPYGRHGGDLRGIINHLDYLEEMGFTALWLNPVLENDQPQWSYHGYAMTDFYKVDPRFGTNEDYRELALKAKDRGIKLIMDMVFNHCGSEHWWMEDLPSADWINYSTDPKITNHRRTTNQDLYAAKTDYELMRDGWFVPSMPDLNLRNPFMAEYLVQNSIWWIETLGLSGIRMDTYPYPDKYAMAEWCHRVMNEYPDFNIVGEEWSLSPITISYWQEGKINHDGYEGHLPTLMDFPLQHAVAEGLKEEENWNSGLIQLYEALSYDYIYPDPQNLMIFPDNHDMPRFYMQLDMNKALYKIGITYFLTMRGIPQILYGSEILMDHPEGDSHGLIRKDFPGGWDTDKVNAFTGENLGLDAAETQAYFRKLLQWRKNKEVIHTGSVIHFAPDRGTYVYGRYNNTDTIMVIINKTSENMTLSADRFRELTGDHTHGTDVVSGKEIDLVKEFSAPAMTALVLELN